MKTTPLHPPSTTTPEQSTVIHSNGSSTVKVLMCPLKLMKTIPLNPPSTPAQPSDGPIGTVSQSKPGPFTAATLIHRIANAFTSTLLTMCCIKRTHSYCAYNHKMKPPPAKRRSTQQMLSFSVAAVHRTLPPPEPAISDVDADEIPGAATTARFQP